MKELHIRVGLVVPDETHPDALSALVGRELPGLIGSWVLTIEELDAGPGPAEVPLAEQHTVEDLDETDLDGTGLDDEEYSSDEVDADPSDRDRF